MAAEADQPLPEMKHPLRYQGLLLLLLSSLLTIFLMSVSAHIRLLHGMAPRLNDSGVHNLALQLAYWNPGMIPLFVISLLTLSIYLLLPVLLLSLRYGVQPLILTSALHHHLFLCLLLLHPLLAALRVSNSGRYLLLASFGLSLSGTLLNVIRGIWNEPEGGSGIRRLWQRGMVEDGIAVSSDRLLPHKSYSMAVDPQRFSLFQDIQPLHVFLLGLAALLLSLAIPTDFWETDVLSLVHYEWKVIFQVLIDKGQVHLIPLAIGYKIVSVLPVTELSVIRMTRWFMFLPGLLLFWQLVVRSGLNILQWSYFSQAAIVSWFLMAQNGFGVYVIYGLLFQLAALNRSVIARLVLMMVLVGVISDLTFSILVLTAVWQLTMALVLCWQRSMTEWFTRKQSLWILLILIVLSILIGLVLSPGVVENQIAVQAGSGVSDRLFNGGWSWSLLPALPYGLVAETLALLHPGGRILFTATRVVWILALLLIVMNLLSGRIKDSSRFHIFDLLALSSLLALLSFPENLVMLIPWSILLKWCSTRIERWDSRVMIGSCLLVVPWFSLVALLIFVIFAVPLWLNRWLETQKPVITVREKIPAWSLRPAVLSLLVFFIFMTTFHLSGDLWCDEIYSYEFHHSWSSIHSLVVASFFDHLPPLHFILAGLWGWLTPKTHFWFRLPGLIYAILGLVGCYLLAARRFGCRWMALALLSLLAFHPGIIRLACEARVYRLMFLIVMLIYLSHEQDQRKKSVSWRTIGLICFFSWLHVIAFQFILSFIIVEIVTRRFKPGRKQSLVLFVVWALLVFYIVHKLHTFMPDTLNPLNFEIGLLEFLKSLLLLLFTGLHSIYAVDFRLIFPQAVPVLLVLVLVSYEFRSARKLLAVILLTTLQLYIISNLIDNRLSYRYFYFVTGIFWIAIFHFLKSRYLRQMTKFLLIIFLILSTGKYSWIFAVDPRYANNQWTVMQEVLTEFEPQLVCSLQPREPLYLNWLNDFEQWRIDAAAEQKPVPDLRYITSIDEISDSTAESILIFSETHLGDIRFWNRLNHPDSQLRQNGFHLVDVQNRVLDKGIYQTWHLLLFARAAALNPRRSIVLDASGLPFWSRWQASGTMERAIVVEQLSVVEPVYFKTTVDQLEHWRGLMDTTAGDYEMGLLLGSRSDSLLLNLLKRTPENCFPPYLEPVSVFAGKYATTKPFVISPPWVLDPFVSMLLFVLGAISVVAMLQDLVISFFRPQSPASLERCPGLH